MSRIKKPLFQQQGDVLISSIDDIPSVAKPRSDNHIAEGEATGHYHGVEGDGVSVLEIDDVRYVDAPNGAKVTHQEHHEQILPPGKYEINRVREYDHFAEEARTVMD